MAKVVRPQTREAAGIVPLVPLRRPGVFERGNLEYVPQKTLMRYCIKYRNDTYALM